MAGPDEGRPSAADEVAALSAVIETAAELADQARSEAAAALLRRAVAALEAHGPAAAPPPPGVPDPFRRP